MIDIGRTPGAPVTRPRERGSMSIEMVLLTPVMVAFILLVVAMGRYVAVRGDIEAASRDGVRAASMERSFDAASLAALQTASASLNQNGWTCPTAQLAGTDGADGADGEFEAGTTIRFQLGCKVPWSGLGLIGLPGTITVQAVSYAPLDLYRRTE